MSETLRLDGLSGTNPLGFFAALGVLDVLDRRVPDRTVRLAWTDDVVPRPVLHGAPALERVIELIDQDRQEWATSQLLTWGPRGKPLDDVKPPPNEARAWLEAVAKADEPLRAAELRLIAALFAEGAVDASGKGLTKPTHLHFTAGRQLFLAMVRELASGVDSERIEEALMGPWRYDSPLPVLGWEAGAERVYAVRATNPAEGKNKKLGVPGADWLGFLSLTFFPVWVGANRRLWTTGCDEDWKRGGFCWPLWSPPLSAVVARALLRDVSVRSGGPDARRARGIHTVLRAPIRRSDQGGYGSFGAPEPVPTTSIGGSGRRGRARRLLRKG